MEFWNSIQIPTMASLQGLKGADFTMTEFNSQPKKKKVEVIEHDSSFKPGQIVTIHKSLPKNMIILITSYLQADQQVRLVTTCSTLLNKVQNS
jgi:hypothetical protein